MRQLLLISGTAAMLLAGAGIASAQHHHDGHRYVHARTSRNAPPAFDTPALRSFRDPHFHAHVGAILPDAAQIYPLPHTLAPRVAHGQQYGYGLVNEKPVIVDHSSRRIIQVSTDAIIASRLNPSVSEVVSGSKAPMVSTSVSTAKASAELEARLLTNATW